MVSLTLSISAGLAIVLGLIILIWPKFLRWGLGLWLIVHGALQFFG